MKRLAGLIVTTFVLAGLQIAARAQGADTRSLEKKATTAFGLGRYAEAAENYEKAFEIRSEPALLYNAAQAYRLAGNKERALTLYQNYYDGITATGTCSTTCGTQSQSSIGCDGPNDCPAGQVCCYMNNPAGYFTACYATQCPTPSMTLSILLCDPAAAVCPAGKTCTPA